MELHIDMVREDDGTEFSWTYQTFRAAGADDNYRLTIGEGEGTGHDAMRYHNNHQFTTYDRDNEMSGLVVIVHSFFKEDGGTIIVTMPISMAYTESPQLLE